ncbi:site-specific DNA-methyltransferase [Gordonia alkanivorans]|uniref:site-specific DNA-methyltransferase n=1 Tax=Gordonia alkanivorans TaxID=84096 RepID=UPI000FDEBC7F|nr:site-specific DNA-methyltransferase [Gordonia alkanivorans]AZZ82287.1 site-specific DNA-methyltransferase [Gordonia alkanivorans]
MSNDKLKDIYETPSGTPDFKTELAAQLSELFPEAIADGKVDVEKLKELLGDDAGDDRERFGLFWAGKKRALRAAQEPTTATLKPDYENSKDWDTTKNVFIEGDNLEVLKILQKHYHGKIKMIYIDPPYNTGKDFVYPDNYREGLATYLEWTRQVNEEGKKVRTNSDSEGRFHSNWLNMMYPRLKLARNLLTQDGVVAVSINDVEVANLKHVMDQVFGSENFVATVVWKNATDNNPTRVAIEHEYIVIYARRIASSSAVWKSSDSAARDLLMSVGADLVREYDDQAELSAAYTNWFREHRSVLGPLDRYKYIDRDGVYTGSQSVHNPGKEGYRYDVIHPVTGKACTQPLLGYRFPEQTMRDLLTEGRVLFGEDETKIIELKVYAKDYKQKFPSVIELDGRLGANELRTLFPGSKKVFTNPKPVSLIREVMSFIVEDGDTVLDFFAGSGTSAHAVMAMNAADGGSRRFIQVQLPEPTPEPSDARSAGLTTISAITRRRIDLAGDQIRAARPELSGGREVSLDVGYRGYTLTDTNFAKWQVSGQVEPSALEQHLLDLRDSADDTAAPDSLLTELLLKQGYSLTEQIRDAEVDGLKLKSVGNGLVLAYLHEHTKPTLQQLRSVLDSPELARFIILEDAFKGDDELKTNLVQEAKTRGVELWTA